MGHLHHAGRFVIMTTPQLTPSAIDEATDTDVDLSLLESLDFAIPCDIEPTDETPEHDAEVYATFSCGHGAFYCAPHANGVQDVLAQRARLGDLLGILFVECVECGEQNPTVVMIQPIADSKADSGRSDRSGRA
jgi:hypothetical protein